MSNRVDLSIIIPIYNTADYLTDCFDSLYSQNLENFEIIAVNDGSTDESQVIIEKYAAEHHNFRFIIQKNQGQSRARNEGVRLAKGRYIYFMDSDDKLREGSLNRMLKLIDENNLEAIFFDGMPFYEEGVQKEKENSFKYRRSKSYGIYELGEKLFAELIREKEFTVSPCLFIFKKSVIENKLEFPEGFVHEDAVFTPAFFLLVGKCMHVNEAVFLRRIRAGSTMTGKDQSKRLYGYSQVLVYTDRIFASANFKTEEGRQAFLKRIEVIYKLSLEIYYHYPVDKDACQPSMKIIKEIGKKHQYFTASTRFYSLLIRSRGYYYYLSNKSGWKRKVYQLLGKNS